VGNGVIIDPALLLRDMDALSNNGIDYTSKLKISDRCHFVTEI
jgi:adenylosuccinate synthase